MRYQVYENASDEKLAKLEEEILKDGLLKIAHTPKGTFAIRKSFKKAIEDILWKVTVAPYFIRGDVAKTENTINAINGTIQCYRHNFRRSQGDLFRIAKYYYPNITFKKFRAALFKLTSEYKVQTSYCRDIHKRVFCTTMRRNPTRKYTSIFDSTTEDELGLNLKVELV